ncbi:MAG TPA: amidohydrolase [Candidatus Acidoferrum sp.]|jgi:predicted amidohydrolase YtcJ|nr:amidohydrolase [Candidatus Acidoferrum sp.]
MNADLILARGSIRTLGRSGLQAFSHLATARGTVAAVGGSEVLQLKGPQTRVIDLRGGAVLPGFNDAHAHVVYYGLTRFGADLGGARSVDEIVRRLREHGRSLKKGEWQLGLGYRVDELAELRPPHRTELDLATGDRPCYIDERGGHARVANTAALAAAGLMGPGQDPPGGRIGRDRNGLPNGLLLEAAMRLVADVQPPPPIERRQEGILLAQRLFLSRGVTSVGAAVNRGFADDLRAYSRLAADGRLKMRINEFLSWELLEATAGLGVRKGFGGHRLRAGPIKVFVDGGAERVAMRSGGGVWRTTPEELRALVDRASRAGLQVAAHAIGDGAIEAMCDAVAAAGATGLRHRVEHCTICPADLQARLARLGMVAVMQPMAARFGRVASALLFPARDRKDLAAHGPLLKAGVAVAFSSDLPVSTDPNPWPGIRAAVDDQVNGVGMLAALRAYTAGGAFASFEEHYKGTLEPGMVADLQVYDRDPLSDPTPAWDQLCPVAVFVGGVRVHGRIRAA